MKSPTSSSSPAHIVAPDNCTSCSLCANVCGSHAIEMVWNQDGFLIPYVHEEACVSCGLCVKKCPAINPPTAENHDFSPRGFAAWHRDLDIRRKSSSGGVFTALATQILSEGGIVYGVAWEEGFHARFKKATTCEELKGFRGSKYVQAEPGFVYREIRELLKQGQKVFFTGTPCQVEALKVFLRKDHPLLLTASVACHGTPSRLLLRQYIREKERAHNSAMTGWEFRNKENGWVEYLEKQDFSDGSSERTIKHHDAYMKIYLSDLAMKKGCFSCRHSYNMTAVPRNADLGLGDFWSVGDYHPDWNRFDGISTVLCLSQKGLQALESCRDKLILHEEPYERAADPTRRLDSDPHIPDARFLQRRETALKILRKQKPLSEIEQMGIRRIRLVGFSISEMNPLLRWAVRLVKRCTGKDSPTVAILTLQLSDNYGGILQAFALQKAVEQMGLNAVTLLHRSKLLSGSKKVFQLLRNGLGCLLWGLNLLPSYPLPRLVKERKAQQFIKRHLRTTPLLQTSKIARIMSDKHFDHWILGSDQIWNEEGKAESVATYFLEGFPKSTRTKAIVYAASFGKEQWGYNEEETERCSRLAGEFQAVSVRELSGVELCREHLKVGAVQMPDPTLLLNRDDYEELIRQASAKSPHQAYLATYILDWSDEKEKLIDQIADSLGIHVYHIYASPSQRDKKSDVIPRGIEEWLAAIRDAQYVITDSFHGSVFSIIFNTPFLCLGNEGRGMARFHSLLQTFDLASRLSASLHLESAIRILNTPIDWEKVNFLKGEETYRGLDFLRSNLYDGASPDGHEQG